MLKTLALVSLGTLALAMPAAANDAVQGEVTTYTSPNGLTERCVAIAPIPDGAYSKDDKSDEAAFCAIDLYAANIAMCPKTWSTSPGTMIYDISEGPYANDRASFERKACREGKSAKGLAKDDLAKLKLTMNQEGTSGTFSTASLLYYHFSRYFDMTVKVPVAVWRSVDAATHKTEVAASGLAISGDGNARMNHEGWRHLVEAEENPDSYKPTDELFTADRKQVYGVMLLSPGSRAGSEINGTRRSGWGKGQNLDFQETPPYLALRSALPLDEAIAHGLQEGRKDSQINKDLGPDVPALEMAYWMREISEIVLLDYIFSQQDRVGNIDYTPYYYWLENGEMTHKKAKHHEPMDGTIPEGAVLVRRSNLNDNDAGGRVQYANYAKSTAMLEKLRHFDGGVYRKLMALDSDLKSEGPLYQWTATSVGLDDRQIEQIVKNTALAAEILRASCERGELTFDLNPKKFFETGDTTPDQIACDGS